MSDEGTRWTAKADDGMLFIRACGLSVRFHAPYYELVDVDVRPLGDPHPPIIASTALPFADTHAVSDSSRAAVVAGYLSVEFTDRDDVRGALYSHDFPAGEVVFSDGEFRIILDDTSTEADAPFFATSPAGIGLMAEREDIGFTTHQGRPAVHVRSRAMLVHGPAQEKQRNRATLARSLSESAGAEE